MTIIALLLALLTPCPTEDAVGCYWDAQSMGNGAGTSFIAVTEDWIIR